VTDEVEVLLAQTASLRSCDSKLREAGVILVESSAIGNVDDGNLVVQRQRLYLELNQSLANGLNLGQFLVLRISIKKKKKNSKISFIT